ncbi:putative tetratricopeptide-like helical domain superfamily [Helianthus annuus]|nr:putative tetratricopeptide-like helical domain superfamily [Helianthus annuus]
MRIFVISAYTFIFIKMPSSEISPSFQNQNLEALLESAKPFLREEFHKIDEKLPTLLEILCSAGAGECYHRIGTFLDHLRHVYRTIKLWKAPDSIALCALFHSVYSNSYSNIVLFDPETSRDKVRSLIGEAAERIAYLFCVVHRQSLVHKSIMCQFTESELREYLKASEVSVMNANDNGVFNGDEKWRKKMQSLVPAGGLIGRHHTTGEEILVSRRMIGVFLLMTIADISEQYFGFQDVLYENTNGRLELDGDRFDALYPGNGKPGLWMNAASRMAAVYTLLVREEAIFLQENKIGSGIDRDEDIELVIPPVFDHCTTILDANDLIMARDLYWEVVCDDGCDQVTKDKSEGKLVKCIEVNPYVGEPHVLLGQFYLSRGRFEEAEKEIEKGLRLLLEWGGPWDKRISWEGWVAWCRVMLNKAKERSWPQTAWGVINLGLVR